MKNEIGVCSWSFHQPLLEVEKAMQQMGVKSIHLALQPFLSGDARHGQAEGALMRGYVRGLIDGGAWHVTATMLSFPYEDYSTPLTIRKTGGIVPDEHWPANQKLIQEAAQLAADFKSPYLSFHAGYLGDHSSAAVQKFTTRVQYMADVCQTKGVKLLLETGQESAADLAHFMSTVHDVGINFDPANMLLYGMGDPVKAVPKLAPWICHVHAKDALAPTVPLTWGKEVPWGEGQVNTKAFLAALKEINYTGALAVEREAGNQRLADITLAVKRLQKAL